MTHTRKELARKIRECDMLTIPTEELGPLCQAFGLSGIGQRTELIERLHKGVWRIELGDDGWPIKLRTWKELNQ